MLQGTEEDAINIIFLVSELREQKELNAILKDALRLGAQEIEALETRNAQQADRLIHYETITVTWSEALQELKAENTSIKAQIENLSCPTGFDAMMKHLESGGKARRKEWEQKFPNDYWYADGDNIIESIENKNAFLDLSTTKLTDWILF